RLRAWHGAGVALYVYSSGSVAAQKLLFGHTDHGDLTTLFSGWFDTTTGPKREAESYRKIALAVAQPPKRILFLSDSSEELDAASAPGLRTVHVVRSQDGTRPSRYPTAETFYDVNLD